MKRRPGFLRLLALALAAAPLAAVMLAAQPAVAALPKPVAPPVPGGRSSQSTLDQLPDSVNPISYSSAEGQFETTFPTGCARVHTKQNTPAGGATADTAVEVRVVFATCERQGRQEEGCLVNARLGALGDLTGQAAADRVRLVVGELLSDYGVAPFRQVPVARDFGPHGKVEGVDVHARKPAGEGEVWIRGLMRGPDMYFLLAWKAAGGLFTDPEYAVFFNEFQPWAD